MSQIVDGCLDICLCTRDVRHQFINLSKKPFLPYEEIHCAIDSSVDVDELGSAQAASLGSSCLLSTFRIFRSASLYRLNRFSHSAHISTPRPLRILFTMFEPSSAVVRILSFSGLLQEYSGYLIRYRRSRTICILGEYIDDFCDNLVDVIINFSHLKV